MTARSSISEERTKSLFSAIISFLRDQFHTRNDLALEDRYSLEIAVQYLKMACGLEGEEFSQNRFPRPLLDVFKQVRNPVSVKEKIQADAHKEEGNNYIRRNMFVDAETEYTNAVKLDKWNSIYYANRASARIGQRHYLEAIDDCRQAIALNPDYAKAHARMGQAYAFTPLIDRHRKAAECFRRALEFEPRNQRYMNNLRTALNQVYGPDVAQVTANLLGPLFGFGRQNAEDSGSRTLPTSFIIIAESHPPTASTSSETAENAQNTVNCQISQNSPKTENHTQTNEISLATSNEISNITFSRSCGVTDKGARKRPTLQFESHSLNPGGLEINTPLAALGFEFGPTQPSSSQADSSLQNTKMIDERHSEKLHNNAPGEEALPQHESEEKLKGLENSCVAPLSDFESESDETLLREYRESCSSAEQNDDPSGKNTIQACACEATEKVTDDEKKEEKIKETALPTAKDSSNNAFDEQKNRASQQKSKENTMNSNTTSCTKKISE